jgi:CBS domain-containing protein
VVGTFDYSDLNAYLLLVVGLAQPNEDQVAIFRELAQKGREGKPIPMKDVKDLGRKEPLVLVTNTDPLTRAVEIFGSGIHRIVVVDESTKVIGVLTQLRLVEFFWENRSSFHQNESLFPKTLKDLDLASHSVFAINGDKPLTAALEIINNEGITSLPVLDNQRNVVGNISHVDVRVSLPL